MEHIHIEVSSEKFDAAVHGIPDMPSLSEGRDLAVYVKPRATAQGKAAVVICFTVRLPDGSLAMAQATTTAAMLEAAGAAIRGWREGGHIS